MRLAATACAALLLTGCLHAQHKQAESHSEIFAVPAAGNQSPEAQSPSTVSGSSTPLWAKLGDLKVPGWEVKVTQLDEERFRVQLRMRTLITGGDGEARTAFLRSAREIVDAGGYAGYDVLRYEEGIDSGLFFGRRGASGEIRVVQSRIWAM